MELSDTIKQIKRSFRLYMNGTASHSMREKGLDYKVNWGVSQVELRRMAADYDKDARLAAALWQENVRECKILATFLMPASQMSMDEAVEWGRGITSCELAETVVFNLFRRLPFATSLAGRLLGGDMFQRYAAYHLMMWLLKGGQTDCAEMPASFWTAARADIVQPNVSLRKVLAGILLRLHEEGGDKSAEAAEILTLGGIDAF